MAWNRPSENAAVNAPSSPRRQGSVVVRGAIAAAIVVVGAIAAWFFLAEKEPDAVQQTSARPTAIREVKSAIATNRVAQAPAPKPKEEKPAFVKRPGAMQLPDGQVLTFPPPKEGEPRKVFAYGRMYECDHLGNFKDITPRQFFKTAFEANFFALANEGQHFIPAFLVGLNQRDVRNMLLKAYKFVGDETPEERQQLENYDKMRTAALDYMDAGGEFDDFVNEFAEAERKQKQARVTGLSSVMALYKQGKIAEAKEMADAANVMMDKNGYQHINLPAHVLRAFEQLPK